MKPVDPHPNHTANCVINNEDCIQGMAAMPPASVHLTVTSIPFEELFTYSGKPEDVGNNGSTVDCKAGRFALNMRFCIDALHRVTAPGCNACIHIQQLLAYKNQHGFVGRRDFRGAVIDLFRAGDWHFQGEAAIPKNPQVMAQRLNLMSLQFKTGKKRSATILAPAVNDYLLIFNKPGEIETPVRGLHDEKENPGGWFSGDDWVRWASGCWDDIDEIDVLDGWRAARETDEEKHVCPLQLEVIRRCVELYSNPISVQPDATVLDPFMGIGSTAYVCLGGSRKAKSGAASGPLLSAPRNVVGFELKESYHDQATRNVKRARAAWTRHANRKSAKSDRETLL